MCGAIVRAIINFHYGSISTEERSRKERSVHDACMGRNIEQIDVLNPVNTDSDLHKNSWRYWGFHCSVQPSTRKSAVAFRHISTTRARTAKQTTPFDPAYRIGLSTLLNDVLTVDEGFCGWRFKSRQIGHVSRYISATRPRTSKRRTILKSARQIGVSTIS